MKKIGFIGLGIMGYPMTRHLLEAGFEVTVYNRTLKKSQELAELGAEIGSHPADVASKSEVVFLMLANDAVVEEICLGDQGITEGAHNGLVLINSSTSYPAFNIDMHEKMKALHVEYLDVPVTGSGIHAQKGVLTFMGGGNEVVFEKCRPMMEAMGKNVYYMGEIGAGSYTKLANNTMLAINLVSFAEAVTLVAKAGVDPELFVKVASGGGAKSGMSEAKVGKVVTRDFSPAFKVESLVKDLKLISKCSEEKEIPMPVLALVRELVSISKSQGYAEEDVCAIVKCYEEWAGTTVTKEQD